MSKSKPAADSLIRPLYAAISAEIPDLPPRLDPGEVDQVFASHDPVRLACLPLAWATDSDGQVEIGLNRTVIGLRLAATGQPEILANLRHLTGLLVHLLREELAASCRGREDLLVRITEQRPLHVPEPTDRVRDWVREVVAISGMPLSALSGAIHGRTLH